MRRRLGASAALGFDGGPVSGTDRPQSHVAPRSAKAGRGPAQARQITPPAVDPMRASP